MPMKLRKPRTKLTMADVEARLARMFVDEEALRAAAVEAGDYDRAKKHTDACIGLAPQIRGAHEVNDQEERLRRVEAAVGTHIRKVG